MSSGDNDASRIDRKRILEEAAADPDASSAELAARIPDASTEHVEQVLDGGGSEEHERPDPSSPETDYPDQADISDRQIRTLQAIAAHPDATQRDIASFLDVTAATVSNRVNSLPGFEWDDRRRFVKAVLDLDIDPGGERATHYTDTSEDLQKTVQDLRDRVERLESRLESGDNSSESPFDDPELVRKIVHVCMAAEEITDEEEQRILQAFLSR